MLPVSFTFESKEGAQGFHEILWWWIGEAGESGATSGTGSTGTGTMHTSFTGGSRTLSNEESQHTEMERGDKVAVRGSVVSALVGDCAPRDLE